MSNQMLNEVLADQRTSGSVRMVLVVLADMANERGECWPGFLHIARRANVDRRTVITSIAWLEEHGFLVVTRRLVPGRKQKPNLYQIRIPGESFEAARPKRARPRRSMGDATPPVVTAHPMGDATPPVVVDHPMRDVKLPTPVVRGHPIGRITPPVVIDHPMGDDTPPMVIDHPMGDATPPVVTDHPMSDATPPIPVMIDHPMGDDTPPKPLINPQINPQLNQPPPPPPPPPQQLPVVGEENIFRLYEQNFGLITPLIADVLKDAETTYPLFWIESAMKESIRNNNRRWSYCEKILQRWKRDGFGADSRKKPGRERSRPGRAGGENYAERMIHWADKQPE